MQNARSASDVKRAFRLLPDAARDHAAVVPVVVRRNPNCLEDTSEPCREDKEIVFAVVRQYGDALRAVGRQCKDDKEALNREPIACAAITRTPRGQAKAYAIRDAILPYHDMRAV